MSGRPSSAAADSEPRYAYDYGACVRQFAQAYHSSSSSSLSCGDTGGSRGDSGVTRCAASSSWATAACAVAETLSQHCPMTPLLWLQYAHAARQAILHSSLRYDDDSTTTDTPTTALLSSSRTTTTCHAEAASAAEETSKNKNAALEAAAVRCQVNVLELGLLEFPGSALLHHERVVAVVVVWAQQMQEHDALSAPPPPPPPQQQQQQPETTLRRLLSNALHAVGRKSHLVCPLVHHLYQIGMDMTDMDADSDDWRRMLQRSAASHCPLLFQCSDNTTAPTTTTTTTTTDADTKEMEIIEALRKHSHKHYQQFRTYEDEIAIALQQQYQPHNDSLYRIQQHDQEHAQDDDDLAFPWKTVSADTCPRGMGLGTLPTARAFVRYARAVLRLQAASPILSVSSPSSECPPSSSSSFNNNDELLLHQHYPHPHPVTLALHIFERGIAECPTVEYIWTEYLHLLRQQTIMIQSSTSASASVASGAVANKTTTSEKTDTLLSSSCCSSSGPPPPPPLLLDIGCSQSLDRALTRAVRNCPYSLRLWQARITDALLLSRSCHTSRGVVFDPDVLWAYVHEALDSGFLFTHTHHHDASLSSSSSSPHEDSSMLSALHHHKAHVIMALYSTFLWTLKQRILIVLTEAVSACGVHDENKDDDDDHNHKKNKKQPQSLAALRQGILTSTSASNTNNNNNTNNQALLQEAADLLDDLQEVYEELDQQLRHRLGPSRSRPASTKNTTTTSSTSLSSSCVKVTQQARAWLWRDAALTQHFLIQPLNLTTCMMETTTFTSTTMPDDDEGVLQTYERAIQMHNPPHPHLYLDYIRHLHQYVDRRSNTTTMTSTATAAARLVVQKIRLLQRVYARAVHSVGRTSESYTLLPMRRNHHGIIATTTTHTTATTTPTTPPPSNDGTDATTTSSFIMMNHNHHHHHHYDSYEYHASLAQLCAEWIDFESTWGSSESLQHAHTSVEKKLAAATTAATGVVVSHNNGAINNVHNHHQKKRSRADGRMRIPTTFAEATSAAVASENNPVVSGKRRKREPVLLTQNDQPSLHDNEQQPQQKEMQPMTRTAAEEFTGGTASSATTKVPVSESESRSTAAGAARKIMVHHKIRMGTLDYPAHPYTIKVSNFTTEDVCDMDLVDAFKACGAIVHARMVRDKTHGLVQFEEKESVDAALALDQKVVESSSPINDDDGDGRRRFKVERSHIPAALLVPPGMHRVHDKGHGKYSKRNEQKQQQQQRHRKKDDPRHHDANHAPSVAAATETPPLPNGSAELSSAVVVDATPTMNVLAFRPRMVGRGSGKGGHPRSRIQLSPK